MASFKSASIFTSIFLLKTISPTSLPTLNISTARTSSVFSLLQTALTTSRPILPKAPTTPTFIFDNLISP